MKVLNFGSLNLDYVYQVDHMVGPGETLASAQLDTFSGGKGLNQSIALAKAGAQVYHAGCIGEDGHMLRHVLDSQGVKTDYVKTLPMKTGHAIIQVDKSGQNCILLYGGANRAVTEGYIDEVLTDFGAGDILLLQNEINLLDYIIDRAYEKGMTIILNPSPYDENLKVCDFGKISFLLINEVEGFQITGSSEPEEILKTLRQRYPAAKIVLTLGCRGCIYQHGTRQLYQDAYKVEAVDTTAAGDTFTGYFIASILEGMDAAAGLDLAAKASAIAVTRHGAAPSIPLRSEVLEYQL
ncbi:MAG: ribokinase [Dialister sp.]|nr:ribokinase [Dialister sp.]